MKFSTVTVAVLAATAATVAAVPETNAQRLARGLPPNPPARRATPAGARRSTPSGTPSQCNTGPVQCCNSVTTASNPVASLLIGLLGILGVGGDVVVGLTCSPLSVIGIGGNSCSSQPVCCENNNFNGAIAIGCSPINLNL
jgi:hypothetical protein